MLNERSQQYIIKIAVGIVAAAACFSLLVNLPATINKVNADSDVEIDVEINKENFPDGNFRYIVLLKCDTDRDGFLSDTEISNIKKLEIPNEKISDLTGVEYLTALTYLDCSRNQLTSLDLSKNTALERVICWNNQLTSLDVSGCIALKELDCKLNQFKSLDVSGCIALKELDCQNNQLTSLDISKNTVLERLVCYNNKLTDINIENNSCLLEAYAAGEYYAMKNSPVFSAMPEDTAIIYGFLYWGRDYTDYYLGIDRSVHIITKPLVIGWNEVVDGKWVYIFEDGSYATGWQGISGNFYYFDMGGVMKTGWLKDNDSWYYFSATGNMLTGWKESSGIWYYFGNDGKMVTGWQQINSLWYYFDKNGVMITGWYNDVVTIIDGIGYYKGNWYYLSDSGSMETGWNKISGYWYYFGSNGKMAKDWQQIGGIWYYFGDSGKMKTGWQLVDGVYYFFKPTGAMASDEYIDGYYLDKSGAWTYQYRASWIQDSKGWYYQDTAGWYAKNRDVMINGKLYNFNAEGYCTNP